jgi:hypothetical protein
LFGLALTDLFTASNYQVELEYDVSPQQQFLDVVILRQQEGEALTPLPDGLETLTAHNLLSYKSWHEPFDKWALQELVSHYVSYRKLVSTSPKNLKPESDFQLYAITTRYPQKLATQVNLQEQRPGVYLVDYGHPIQVLVLSQLLPVPKNAFWQLFSADATKVSYGRQHYHWKRPTLSSLINQLFEFYHLEDIIMSYTVEDYVRDYTKEHLHTLTAAERVAGLPAAEILQGLSPEQRLQGLSPDTVLQHFDTAAVLQGLSPDQRLQGLSPDTVRQHFALEELLQGLSPTAIEAVLAKLKGRSH